jgi:hypothetical protein
MSEIAGAEAPSMKCARHAQIRAVKVCQQCGAGMCNMCGFGTDICNACSSGSALGTVPATPAPDLPARPVIAPRPAYQRPVAQLGVGVPQGPQGTCVTHPAVTAAARCSNCGALVCHTCDFEVSGMRRGHLCPICAMVPTNGLLPTRKKFVIWGFLMAVWGTVGIGLLLGGYFATMVHDRHDLVSLGYIILFFVFLPALLGLGLSLGAQEKHLPNPPVVWIAVLWNAMLVAGNVTLTIIGNLRK